MLWIRSSFTADPDPAFYLNPDPGRQTNADPDPGSILTLKLQKVEFLHTLKYKSLHKLSPNLVRTYMTWQQLWLN